MLPVGGSNLLGLWGYFECYNELIDQGIVVEGKNFHTDIVVSCGSGGTAAGLAIANYLYGSKVKVHAVCVCDDAGYFYQHIDDTLKELGLQEVQARDIIDIIEGYKGAGYGRSRPNELAFLSDVAKHTGVLLDPTYTVKGAYGMCNELMTSPSRFRGDKVLFLHTGGQFSLFDGTIDKHLLAPNANVQIWSC